MNNNLITGIYPGTFDPITYGHLDIIFRATHIVNKLIISVAENKNKNPLFNLKERITMIKEALNEIEYLLQADINAEVFIEKGKAPL